MTKTQAIALLNTLIGQAKDTYNQTLNYPELNEQQYLITFSYIQGMLAAFHLSSVFTDEEYRALETKVKLLEQRKTILQNLQIISDTEE